MAISKSLRYQILSRDGHRCTYCRATPDGAALVVDHVQPETLGGKTEPANLTTACGPCNSGKSATPPDAAKVAEVDADARRWADAMRRAAEIQAKGTKVEEARVTWFGREWNSWTDDSGNTTDMATGWGASILSMIRAGASKEMLEEAVGKTMRKKMPDDGRWKYFCAIIWRQLRERTEIARSLVEEPAPNPEGEIRSGGGKTPYSVRALRDIRKSDVGYMGLRGWARDDVDRIVIHATGRACRLLPSNALADYLLEEEPLYLGAADLEPEHIERGTGPTFHFCPCCCPTENECQEARLLDERMGTGEGEQADEDAA